MLKKLNNQAMGIWAESVVNQALRADGHRLIEMNFSLQSAEYDLVSLKHQRLYVTEVKYRQKESTAPFEVISTKQLRDQIEGLENLLEFFEEAQEVYLQLAIVSGNSSSYKIEYFTDLSPIIG